VTSVTSGHLGIWASENFTAILAPPQDRSCTPVEPPILQLQYLRRKPGDYLETSFRYPQRRSVPKNETSSFGIPNGPCGSRGHCDIAIGQSWSTSPTMDVTNVEPLVRDGQGPAADRVFEMSPMPPHLEPHAMQQQKLLGYARLMLVWSTQALPAQSLPPVPFWASLGTYSRFLSMWTKCTSGSPWRQDGEAGDHKPDGSRVAPVWTAMIYLSFAGFNARSKLQAPWNANSCSSYEPTYLPTYERIL